MLSEMQYKSKLSIASHFSWITLYPEDTSNSSLKPFIMENDTVCQLYKSALPTELAAVTIIVSVFILASNVFVLLTFRRMGKLALKHYYILGLVGSDIMMLAVMTSISVVSVLGEVCIPPWLCDVFGMATVGAEITALIHTAMSVDKFVSVKFPVGYRVFQANSRSRSIIIAIVLMSFIFPTVLTFIFGQVELLNFYFDSHIPYCIMETGERGLGGILIITGVFIAIPMIVQTISNTYLVVRVSNLRGSNRDRLCKSIKTVITTLGVYYLCWTPIGIWLFWGMASDSQPPGYYTFFATHIVVANSGMSFPIYFVTLPKFREKFLSLIRRKNRTHPAPST